MTRVEITDVSVTYPVTSSRAVDHVSLTVNPGELLCLVGPSGCGKTSLLKVICGLISPTTGAVLFDGQEMGNTPPERRRAVMVFQSHLLFPFMSVLENVGFALRMQGLSRTEWAPAAESMLERVQLGGYAGRRPASLSAGQRQRVALARALVAEPRVLLLDEPLANLDRHLREEMREAILSLQRETELTTICVTHDQEEAVLLGDRVAMLAGGSVRQVGTAEEFYERPVSMEVARFFGNHNQLPGVRTGAQVTTPVGTLTIPNPTPEEWPQSGTVCLHARPETITLSPCEAASQNCIRGTVTHRVYVGTHIRFLVDVDGKPWQVVCRPSDHEFRKGDEIFLQIPPERIWLTPD
jgi:ABC-type Fe3+/spermidine/putrescine transport system ATPase subunit